MKSTVLLLAALLAAGAAHAAEQRPRPGKAPITLPLQADAPVPRIVVVGHRSPAAQARLSAEKPVAVAQAKARRDANCRG
ncbi:hypothetical protein [Niveibacterium microcysteis]|uniref:Uncharacterized protein n=1 Tax=Niveibacterium microcysteis TaxID=2811415 RepID=A0ABX7M5L1_9RHOO|nr:hypothetical protein [Niveibacterium microcysteis]QSI77032.1 hypothetical protein JY500_21730 [Niveibacterium microcysteis]